MRFRGSADRSRQRRGRSLARWSVALLAFAVWSGALFAGGMSFFEFLRPGLLNLSGATNVRHAAVALVAAPANLVRSLVSPAPVERIAIDIKFKHLDKIHHKRAEALEKGVLLTGEDDFVPAVITHRGRTVRVNLRLKGDLVDHFGGEKWSFRVHVRGDDHLFGMRRFSLQAPRTRGFHTEMFFMDHLRREGVLAPRYFFVDTVVNGNDIGLMAVEEHFAKELLESQQRREGVIVKFDETPFWENVVSAGDHGPFDNFRAARIDTFTSGKIERSPVLAGQRRVAVGLLRAFVNGALPARDVFDVELMARFLAVSELWRSQHALRWHNARYYLNPVSQRLEPVGFDANLHLHYVGRGLVVEQEPLSAALLEDPEIRRAFVRALRRIAGDFVEGELVDELRALEEEQLAVLHAEYPFRAPYDFRPVVRRASRLRILDESGLGQPGPLMLGSGRSYATPLHAYLEHGGDGPVLELTNALPLPVSVTALRFSGGQAPPGAVVTAPGVELPLALPPTRFQQAPARVRIPVRSPGGATNGNGFGVEGVARVEGRSESYAFRAVPYDPLLTRSPVPHASLDEALARHPFLSQDPDGDRLRVAPGRWQVDGSLVLPDGMGLVAGPGTRLRFASGEGLFASGPLLFSGSAEAPVVLEGPAGDDAAQPWAGVVVMDAPEPSRWEHVHVLRTGGIDRADWTLTGGVVFRRSPLVFEHCRFEGNRAEDALNAIRTTFELRDVHFGDTASDAFDGDFTEGVIEGGSYTNIGGDAIDVSGSRVSVKGVKIRAVRDKAVSVGEASRLAASGLDIRSVGVGFAAKDRSHGDLRDSFLDDVAHVALMAYVKKPEYGPAELEARGNSVTRTARLALAQTGSRLVVDGEVVPEEDVDIDRIYEEGYMRK